MRETEKVLEHYTLQRIFEIDEKPNLLLVGSSFVCTCINNRSNSINH
jgi:hypothetical protein